MYKPKKKYVLGFLFSEDNKYVSLIWKKKPEEQKGLLNGIGGKVEDGEDYFTAIEREFFEETGVKVSTWFKRGVMQNKNWIVYVFCAFDKQIHNVSSPTDEKVEIIEISNISSYKTYADVNVLIPLCITRNLEQFELNYF